MRSLKLVQKNFLTREFLAAVSSWKSKEEEVRKTISELRKRLWELEGQERELKPKLLEVKKELKQGLKPLLTSKEELLKEKQAYQRRKKELENFLAQAIEPLKEKRKRILKERRKLKRKLNAYRLKEIKEKEKSTKTTPLLERVKRIRMNRTMQSIEKTIESIDKELIAIDGQIRAKQEDFDNKTRPYKEKIQELSYRLKSDCNNKIRSVNNKIARVDKQLAAIAHKEKAIKGEIEGLESRGEQFKILGQIEIKIRNRECQVLFPSPNDLAALIKRQNHEPVLCHGKLHKITDKSYVFPEEPTSEFYQSSEALHRAFNRYRAKVRRVRERIAREREVLEESLDLCSFYIYKNNLYFFNDSDTHTSEEQILLIKQHYFKQEKKFERLRKEIRLFEKLESMEVQSREPIPEDIRFIVWRRDGGKCVKCGSRRDLEFDHIIPVSKGGSNTERNIQLLCQRCNREKHNKI